MRVINPVLNHISITRFTIKAAGLFTLFSMMNKGRLESVRKGEAQFRPMLIPTLIGLSAALEFTQAVRALKAFKHTKSLYALMHGVNASVSGLQMVGSFYATAKLFNPWWLANSHYRALVAPEGPYNHCLDNDDAPNAAKIESLAKGLVQQTFSYPPIEEALEIGKTLLSWVPSRPKNWLTKNLPQLQSTNNTLRILNAISTWYEKGNGSGLNFAKLPHERHLEWGVLVAKGAPNPTNHSFQNNLSITLYPILYPIQGVGLMTLTGLSIFLDARQHQKIAIGTFFTAATLALYFKRPSALSPIGLFKKHGEASFKESLAKAASISGRYVAPSSSRMRALSTGILAMRLVRGIAQNVGIL